MVKATFVLDPEAVQKLRLAAERLSRPQSWVVREAIREYAERLGRMGESERRRWLRDFDALVPRIPERPLAEVRAELREIRRARRRGGRRSAS
jgi:predicted transcriptional regulator